MTRAQHPAVVAAAAACAAAAAVVVALAAPAGALPILGPEDAAELADSLAEARADQGVCYGWVVDVDDATGVLTGRDIGSSAGVGSLPDEERCDRQVVFHAEIVYTHPTSEAQDHASFEVLSDPAGMVTADDLGRIGVDSAGLLGADDDAVLANAVRALPALVAGAGLAPAVELDPNTEPLPPGDRATGTPRSDWLRRYGGAFGLTVAVAVGGLAWGVYIITVEHPFRRYRRLRSAPSPPGGTL